MAKKIDLNDPIFHDDDAARVHLESLLWPDGPVCPRCGVMGDRITKLKGKSTRPGVYKCKDCRKPFSVTVNTVMERSHIPLHKWLLAAQFMASSKKGMSAKQLERMLGCNYESAWFLFHRLRECAGDIAAKPLGGENKVVEADESFFGGKKKNRAYAKEEPKKCIVMTLVERDGESRSFHVPNVTAKTLRTVIAKTVQKTSYIMTDEHVSYPSAVSDFAGHGRVNHSADEYSRFGFFHTNTAECRFSLMKRAVYGTHHSVSEQHLGRYLLEWDHKWNTRKMTDVERRDNLLEGAKGKRLMYRQPGSAANA